MRPLKTIFFHIVQSVGLFNILILDYQSLNDLTKGVKLMVLEASITGSFTPNSITGRIVHTLHTLLEIIL